MDAGLHRNLREEAEVVVIALGNILMADEGIGPRVLAELGEMAGVEMVDQGTNGFAVIHSISGKRKAVFVDCAFMGETAGQIRRFVPEEVAGSEVELRLSQHEGDLLSTIEMARALGTCPEEIVIFGIQPATVAPGLSLSEPLERGVDQYVRLLRKELGCTHA